jgi:hypothetical protein
MGQEILEGGTDGALMLDSLIAKFLEQGIVLLDRWVVRTDRGLL